MKDFSLGVNGVGFKNERIIDYSRSYNNDYRTLQVFVWYPTKENTLEKLKYKEYFILSNAKGNNKNQASRKTNVDSLIHIELNQIKELEGIEIKLSTYKALTTISQPNAPIKEGNFPLLLFAPGGNTPSHLHSVIAEYLASHGYIVISFPSLGNISNERWPFSQIGLDIHIDDMSLIINHFHKTLKDFISHKTGLISWSVGGVSQSIYGMKNSNIDMFISLDSGIGRVYGIEMLKKSKYFDYNKFQIPYLHITGNQPDLYVVEKSSEFIDSISSKEKYSLGLNPFSHQHFTSSKGIIPSIASELNKEIAKAYIKMCEMVLIFTDVHLKKDLKKQKDWLEIIKKY